MSTLSLPLRRTAALSLLFAAIIALYTICIDPFVSAYSDNTERAARLESALQKYRQMAARLPALTQALEELRMAQSSQQGYLTGANEAIAAATLQDRVKALIAREGGRLQSTQAMPQARVTGKPQRVGIRAHMVMHLAELQAVIYRLESMTPVLFIENVSIRSVAPGAAEESLLDVTLDIVGYLVEATQ
jgi:general secretion pathway protein M